jgi:heme oxygenase
VPKQRSGSAGNQHTRAHKNRTDPQIDISITHEYGRDRILFLFRFIIITSSIFRRRGRAKEINSMTPQTKSSEDDTSVAGAATAGCPYAQALMNNCTNDKPSTAAIAIPPSHPAPLPGVVELKGCPAFSNSSCPFKDAKSPREISERLSQIPPSHLEGQTHSVLMQTLAFFHHSGPNNGNHAAVAKCPVKALLPSDFSFDDAMEEFSLASIMSRLAQEHEEDHSQTEAKDQYHNDENHSTTTIGSFETLESLSPPPPVGRESPNTSTRRLSEALKTGTAAAHEAAESVHFVKNFIRGQIDRELYALLVAQLYHVYNKLEALLEQHAPTHFAVCHFPRELQRMSALRDDVDFWFAAADGHKEPPVSPATRDYMDRLDRLAEEDPLLLLAHAYTRYLGDLSGGKILGRVARRALKLDKDGDGLAFYQFPLVASAKKFKDKYRQSLNELALDDAQVQDMVKEANVAFLLNMRLFEELDVKGGVPGASVRDLDDVYSAAANNAHRFGSQEDAGGVAGEEAQAPCPFAKTGTADKGTATAMQKKGTCPWPFILLHDPKAGMKHYETWVVIVAVVIAVAYRKFMG